MKKSSLAVVLCALAPLLAACGETAPIATTADAAAPVVPTRPSVGQIYGAWALDPQFCDAQGGARGAITIAENRVEAPARSCTMSPPEQNGEGWLVTLECTGSDGDMSERVRFVPEGEDRLALNYIDRTTGNQERLVRCP